MNVALVTVGDELLQGETVNTNAAWLGRELTTTGADVVRVLVVPDEEDAIIRAVRRAAEAWDAVIVTGGLGPTHDDITMEAVAAAFDRPMTENRIALEWIVEERGYDLERLTAGTADLPEGAEPLHNEVGVAPGARIENVYVLPGVPDEMKAMYRSIANEFSGDQRYRAKIPIDEPESRLVPRLEELRTEFDVSVGSYPGEIVVVRLIGEDPEEIETAAGWLRSRSEIADRASAEEHVQPESGDEEA